MSTFVFQGILFTFAFVIGLSQLRARFRRTSRSKLSDCSLSVKRQDESLYQHSHDVANLKQLKELYYKLQNLEEYPLILPQARDTLLFLFSESLESVSARLSSVSGILSIEHYSKEKLSGFMHNEQEEVTKYWEEYVARRRAGHPRELFKTHEDAKRWIKQASPLKYVDGAWLGHLNKSSTPFALRGITKDAWQVLSEEYGDGDLDKHHAYLYSKLVRGVDPTLPRGDTQDFIHPRQGLTDVSIWKAAVAQLLISLFPHEFLPEILGFNLHFEGLSEETLIASRELRELNFDPYYFLLHVSIDNADSGHTAMALQVVVNYMDYLQNTKDVHAVQRAWKGIQAGFILSQSLSSQASKIPQDTSEVSGEPQDKYELALEKVFQSKALASHRIHCNTKTKIGVRTLSEWLDPSAMASHHWRIEFLHSLSKTEKLVHRGESSKSKLVQELSWKGKMFGAFTESEVKAVSDWIDSLLRLDQVYWTFVDQPQKSSSDAFLNQNITADHPVFLSRKFTEVITDPGHSQLQLESAVSDKVNAQNIDLKQLLPLWFAHPALLECFVTIPSKTATVARCSILRFIRAQSGFGIEGFGVAGKDESRRTPTGLLELGLEMARTKGYDEPTSLKDVLERWPSDFALEMLRLSMYPTDNVATLLGLAWAFVGLHKIIASSSILSNASRDILGQITKREDENLKICLRELEREGFRKSDFQGAFNRGKMEIESCFI